MNIKAKEFFKRYLWRFLIIFLIWGKMIMSTFFETPKLTDDNPVWLIAVMHVIMLCVVIATIKHAHLTIFKKK